MGSKACEEQRLKGNSSLVLGRAMPPGPTPRLEPFLFQADFWCLQGAHLPVPSL